MTRDDIIGMAREAGFRMRSDGWFDAGFHEEIFERFAALVAESEREKFKVHAGALIRDARHDATEREREACARIADEWATSEQKQYGNGGPGAAIRARRGK